jgi:hypothetical protein
MVQFESSRKFSLRLAILTNCVSTGRPEYPSRAFCMISIKFENEVSADTQSVPPRVEIKGLKMYHPGERARGCA